MKILDSFVEGGALLDEGDRRDYYYALVEYLATGEVPGGVGAVARAMIVSNLPALENSRARAEAGRRGGTSCAPGEGEQNGKQTAKQNGKQTAKQNGKQTAKQNGKRIRNRNKESTPSGVDEKAHRPDAGWEAMPVRADAPGRMLPPEPCSPDPDEVRAYFACNCLKGAADEFFDHYASQGWLKPNGMPITDWRPMARRWASNQAEFDARRRARGEPSPDECTWAPAADDADELARVERELARAEAGGAPC